MSIMALAKLYLVAGYSLLHHCGKTCRNIMKYSHIAALKYTLPASMIHVKFFPYKGPTDFQCFCRDLSLHP